MPEESDEGANVYKTFHGQSSVQVPPNRSEFLYNVLSKEKLQNFAEYLKREKNLLSSCQLYKYPTSGGGGAPADAVF